MEQNWVVPVGHDVGQWSLSLPLPGETIPVSSHTNFRACLGVNKLIKSQQHPLLPSCHCVYVCELKPLRCSSGVFEREMHSSE